jgi:hypothetical protein
MYLGPLGTAVVVVIALVLIGAAVVHLRSGPWPFPALITGAVTCTVCYIVAGLAYLDRSDPVADTGPTVPTVVGSFVGILTLAAMVISLIPRRPEVDNDRRSPIYLAVAGTLLGAGGLLFHVLVPA